MTTSLIRIGSTPPKPVYEGDKPIKYGMNSILSDSYVIIVFIDLDGVSELFLIKKTELLSKGIGILFDSEKLRDVHMIDRFDPDLVDAQMHRDFVPPRVREAIKDLMSEYLYKKDGF